jgi:hypothetical protein
MVTGISSGKSEGIQPGAYGAAVMISGCWFSGYRWPSRKFMVMGLQMNIEY